MAPNLGGIKAHLSGSDSKVVEHQSRSWYIRWGCQSNQLHWEKEQYSKRGPYLSAWNMVLCNTILKRTAGKR